MALDVKHSFISSILDNLVPGLIKPSHWNASHTVTGDLPVGQLDGGTGANNRSFWRGDGVWAPSISPYNMINIKDFGAVGNGIADDTTAINAAYASLKGLAGTVIWPAGAYRTTGTINIGDFNGGAGAPQSYISTICPGGPIATELRYEGPSNGVALIIARNPFFYMRGLWIRNNTGSRATTTGVIIGGSGTGAFGTQTYNSLMEVCLISLFDTGISAGGNSGAASEITYNTIQLQENNVGFTQVDFNSLDHTFINLSASGNGVGVDTGAAENVFVYGGSSSFNSIADFRVQQNSSTFTVQGFRSEVSSGTCVLGVVSAGRIQIRDCIFKDVQNGRACVTGFFKQIELFGVVANSPIDFNFANTITMVDCNVIANPNTGLPFSMRANDFASNTGCHILCKNNFDISSFPPIAIPDFDGYFKMGNPTFTQIMTVNNFQKTTVQNIAVNSGAPYPWDQSVIAVMRSLNEGPLPGATVPFTTTVVTNATTAAGNNTLHFASVPSNVVVGMLISDVTTGGVIPADAYVAGKTSTTVIMSVNATGGGVGSADTIKFDSCFGKVTPGKNLRVMGQFATSATLAVLFKRNVTLTSAGDNVLVATSGIFFKSDVGKLIRIPGRGTGPWTDWFGAGVKYTDTTHLLVNGAQQGEVSFGTPTVSEIGEDEPDANYMVVVTGDKNETFWVDTISTTGFTVHSSNASSVAVVTCLIVR